MRTGKELIGKPIFSIIDGSQQGSVKDLFVDLDLKLLTGIYLGREGLLSRKVKLIAREDVAVFGIDAVLTTESDVISDSVQRPEADIWLRRDVLVGREVETSGGTKVGTVGDILFDEEAQVAGIALARVHVAGPIAEKKQVLRAAISGTGGREGPMIVDLTMAERPGGPDAEVQEERRPDAETVEQAPAEPTTNESEIQEESTALTE